MSSTQPSLFFIVSLPRSGSTVLTAELDRFEGVVCAPESYFPFMLPFLESGKERSRRDWARIFLESCDAGFVLSEDELARLIDPSDWRATFLEIGKACAQKSGRDPESIRAVVWKSTRALSGHAVVKATGARFILLRRNPINVFDSQFRVEFGIHNRNPARFAAFRQSYEWLFAKFYAQPTFGLEYEKIPDELPRLLAWMGVPNVLRQSGESTMARTVAQCEWHKGLLDGFESKDAEKRRNIGVWRRAIFWGATAAFWPLRFYLGRLRVKYDASLARRIAGQAENGK